MKEFSPTYSLLILIVIPAFWLAIHVTGHNARAYHVLPAQSTATLAGQSYQVEELVRRYEPTILDISSHQPPYPNGMWYEVVSQGDHLVIVYHPTWDDEYHPDTFSNVIYRLYRQAFYGTEQDTEYIEIAIDRASGDISGVRFESGPPGAYDRRVSQHLSVFIERAESGYNITVKDLKGQVVTATAPMSDLSIVQGPSVTLTVQTWNHLFIPGKTGPDSVRLEMPLRFLDDDTYRLMKFATRSHGDVYTPVHRWPTITALTIAFTLLAGGLILFIFTKVFA